MNAPLPRRASLSDVELVRAVAGGDITALGALYDLYEGDVRRVVVRLGVVEADVDDVIHATFLQISRSAKSFDDRYSSARPWVLGLTANVVRRHHRTLGRIARRVLLWSRDQRRTTTIDETLENREALDQLAAAMQRLSRAKREALVLVALEGLSAEQAATSLGVPVGTIWTRLHHARRELRDALEES